MESLLYPMKLKPIFKDKIWGGNKIKTHLGFDYGNLPNCGELWSLSGVEGNETEIENGFLAEKRGCTHTIFTINMENCHNL